MSIRPYIENFVGRKQEIELFVNWLDDIHAAPVIYFYDALEEQDKKGGIGKTRLLQQCFTFVKKQRKNILPVFFDFFNVAERDSIVIAKRVVEALEKRYTDWSAEAFKKALASSQHANSVGSSPATTLQAPQNQLANALVSDLQALQQQLAQNNHYLLLFFDTFELIEANPLIAVLRPQQQFPDNYGFDQVRFVIAGRNSPDMLHPDWSQRGDDVYAIKIQPFNYEEMIEFLQINCICDVDTLPPQKLQVLYQHTEGRPILIALIADVLGSEEELDRLNATKKHDFEVFLVERIAGALDKRAWALLFMAHIYHRFNAEILRLIMSQPAFKASVPEMTFQDLQRELPKLSIVRSTNSGENFVLHDEMRRLINQYCWPKQDAEEKGRRDLSEIAIQYYTQKIGELTGEQNEQARQSYIVERLYHQLYRDGNAGFASFEQHFNHAVRLRMKTFARLLLQEAQNSAKRLSPTQCYKLKLAEARLLRIEESPQAALDLYLQLETDAIHYEMHCLEILYGKGQSYQTMREFTKAIGSYESALTREELQEDESLHADILGELGYIYRLMGNLELAAHYYEESITIQRYLDDAAGYAYILNSLGNLNRIKGDVEGALLMCKIALRIRNELCQKDQLSELYVGLSLSTIGQIYLDRYDNEHDQKDLAAAEDCFQRAFDIYQHLEYRSGVGATYNRLGQIELARAHWKQAKELFEKAYSTSVGFDSVACINSLNKQGRVLASQEQWNEAAELFRRAIELARQANDSRQQAESLIDLSEVLEHTGKPQRNVRREATQISIQYDYYDLLGHIEDTQGDALYKVGNYQGAFKHYRAACRYLALYSRPRYEWFLRKLLDSLLDTPPLYLSEVIDSLIAYWLDFKLDQSYPELPKMCKAVSKHLVL